MKNILDGAKFQIGDILKQIGVILRPMSLQTQFQCTPGVTALKIILVDQMTLLKASYV